MTSFKVSAYQSGEEITLPEEKFFDKSRRNTGISFSGGGGRAYIAALGYLAALHSLNLIQNVDYITGISGGSWATAVYSYSQLPVTDKVLLGEIPLPENIVYDDLSIMNATCARGFTNYDYSSSESSSSYHRHLTNAVQNAAFKSWTASISKIYLEPCGVQRGKPFTWSEDSFAAIQKLNPTYVNLESFYLPRSSLPDVKLSRHKYARYEKSKGQIDPVDVDARPFPIVAFTLIGPQTIAPYTVSNRNYSLVEVSPIATGVLYTRDAVEYKADNASVQSSMVVGGLIDTYAYGTCCLPNTYLAASTTGEIDLSLSCGCAALTLDNKENKPKPNNSSVGSTYVFDLAQAVGASSYATGAISASNEDLLSAAGQMSYWSPVEESGPSAASAQPFLVADGGGLQVDNLISFVQRRLSRIILFCSSSLPMQPSSVWDPMNVETLSEKDIDFDIPSFFGVIPKDYWTNPIEAPSYELTTSQIFPAEEWPKLGVQLQQAQSEGLNVQVMWVYLGRLSEWESKLSPEMQALVQPVNDPENLANTIDSGPFKSFPHYPTTTANINYSQANLLADLTGWSILENAALFREFLVVN